MRYVMMAVAAALPVGLTAQELPTDVLKLPAPQAREERPLPEDPLQRVAYRAVVLQEWPDTPQWKLDIYQSVLDRKLTIDGVARRTTYCPRCSGRTCADGSRVRDGICAASPNIPMHAIIWLASDGLLKVCDRGGLVKVSGGCRSRGENANFDVWRARCVAGCWTGPGTLSRVPWALIPAVSAGEKDDGAE